MNSELRTLFLAATMVAFPPVAPATMDTTHGAENTSLENDDPHTPPQPAAETATDSVDPAKPGDEQQAGTDSAKTAKAIAQKTDTAVRTKLPGNSANGKAIDAELRCLALNIYHEARSQSEIGQEAVAAVTLNRVKSKSFPGSVCKVVKQGGQKRNRCQFSWWCDGKSDRATEREAWKKALEIGRESLLGIRDDPTHGALFYHAKRVRPRWSRKFYRTAKIDDHIFYRPTKRPSVKVATAN